MPVAAIIHYGKGRYLFRWYKRRFTLLFFSIFMMWYINCLPETLFSDSTSTVLLDKNGELLGAHISEDEQWRFEECDSVPYKFEVCIVQFEDREFYNHVGVSVRGIGRAIVQNFSSGRRVSGGSTLTMQLIRLMRKNPARTYSEKIQEMLMATRLEWRLSKKEILRLYASHAPFGNNVVGLDAASWRFFGRPPHQLSWSESATLAVLPNAPGLIYPGRNHDQLMAKRNRLLTRLLEIGEIDTLMYEMAIIEPLPDRPLPLPSLAPHLLFQFIQNGQKGRTITCSVDRESQTMANQVLESHLETLRENKIFNGAIMVTSVKTGEIVAYVGNSVESGREHSNMVNCINARRSTGSILKPLLYAKSLESGLITPKMLLLDVPSKFGGFAPKNFAGNFSGFIPADQALSRSLNIPLVHLLNKYGIGKFHSDLRELGFSTLNKPASHYGLSLILGGAEVTLNDLSNVYTRMAQQVQFNENTPISFGGTQEKIPTNTEFNLDNGCIYAAFEAMLEVRRPDEENNWRMYSSSQKIAWKTGTSFGFRDAWAVGVTPEYVVTVWIGNADGEGRPGLTGVQAAAPVMFDIFNHLPTSYNWFERPNFEMVQVPICEESGHRATANCPNTRMDAVPKTVLESQGCPYHQIIHLDETGMYRVDSECETPSSMRHEPWFIIPSSVEKFYIELHPEFKPIPPFKPSCLSKLSDRSLAIIYPRDHQKIYLPVDLNEEKRKVIFEATHSSMDATLFWHLDDTFYGQTSEIHQLEFLPSVGTHVLTLIDENGVTKKVRFEILGKTEEN
ncbi:MAG: penicillin-binding protein 1C [Crocinitomicaceae bacterium]|nr:penicillin-binding protein 1C [Crocinitomicaceae bacterium]